MHLNHILLFTSLLTLLLPTPAAAFKFQPVTVKVEPVDSDKPSPFDGIESGLPCPAGLPCEISSKDIVRAALSSSTWTLNKPITLILQTSDEMSDRGIILNVDLYRLESRSIENSKKIVSNSPEIPKFYYEGSVIRGYHLLTRDKYYIVTFTPPYFLNPGDYSVVVSHHKKDRLWIREKIHISVKATTSFHRWQLPEVETIASASYDQSVPSRNTANLNDIAVPDHLLGVLKSIDSVTDLCALCSASRTLQLACDVLLAKKFPADLQYTEHTVNMIKTSNNDKAQLSTRSVCQLSHVNVLLQRLEFKLLSIYNVLSVSGFDILKSRRENVIAQSMEIPHHLTMWQHPNLYYHIGTNFVDRLNYLKTSFDNYFHNINYEKLPEIKEPISLEELEDKAKHLLNLPNKKIQMARKLLMSCALNYVPTLLCFPLTEHPNLTHFLRDQSNRCYMMVSGVVNDVIKLEDLSNALIEPARNLLKLSELWDW
ncbi:hypothetical protein BKA69DRAFT_1040975 [Paraphysoderma sedebokerense]|nr:hypothetical protein BKA69DRAFT_1040975 [Paraphysoderma sedebokerense]